MGLDPNTVVSASLVHGDNIAVVTESNIGQKIENTDGLITATPGVILTITVADCLPIYFFDQTKRVVGLTHAGWRGVVKNLASKMIQKMRSEFGTDPKDVLVTIGPHIKECHFEVREDVAEQFKDYPEFILRKDNKINLNLAGVVKKQLEDEGVLSEHISISNDCTYCLDKKYFSFRRDQPERVEAMIAYIGLY